MDNAVAKKQLGQEFIRKGIWDAIDMIYPVRGAEDVQKIASECHVDEEQVLDVLQDYESQKSKTRNEDLTYDVEYVLNSFDLSVDKRLPSFDEFYSRFEKEGSDADFSREEVKAKFEELTKDKNQLKLFEVRAKIRKVILKLFLEQSEKTKK